MLISYLFRLFQEFSFVTNKQRVTELFAICYKILI
jgi:hypothetical protein